MERRRERARRRAGFTLAEVLVTLGIVAVLLALAVPSVAAVQKNLKMAELNATAKEIFLAAQNNLTGIAAGGGAVELSAKSGTADADETACVMSGPDAEVMEKLLPLGAVDPTVAGNHYMVVYYPATLTVKEVYYSERAFSEGGEALQSEYGGEDKAAARRKDEIGFYNGENTTSNPPRSLPKPTLTIENGEELVVKASVPKLEGGLVGKVTLTVTVTSVSDPSKQCRIEARILNNVDLETEIVLDSLTGEHFYEKCPSIDPGDDIEITAEVTYTGSNDDTWLSNKDSKTTNSLFAERAGDTVKIACGRHLQNLDMNTSKIGYSLDAPVTAAVQTAQIFWDSEISFKPIFNYDLTSYNGSGLGIHDLYIRTDSTTALKRVGLFSDFESLSTEIQAQLRNIRLIDPKVDSKRSRDIDTGILAGHIYNAVVVNCQVYATDAGSGYVRGSGSTGGLFGAAVESQISYCSIGLPEVYCNNDSKLGGLIGTAEKTSLSNCYAASDQLSGTAKYIGGLIGRGDGVVILHSYAVGNISANKVDDGYISGFMNGNGTVENSYCAMTYFDENGNAQEREINYGFMSAMEHPTCAYLKPNSPVTILNETKEAQEVTYEELKGWKKSAPWTALDESFSHPYRTLEKDEAKSYPFPGLLTENGSPLPHYGSWPKEPEVPKAGGGLTYYEAYADGTWGYYTVDLETGAVSDTLPQGNEATILDTGYGVLLPKGTTPKALGPVKVVGDYNYSGGMFVETPLENAVTADSALLYPLANAIMTPIDTEIGWSRSGATVTVGDKGTFIINPHFGAAILKSGTASDLGKEQSPLQIRTVAQFNSLATIKTLPNNLYFSQTHDIDFELNGTASGLALNMSIIYDGKGNRLLQRSNPVFQATNSASTIKNVVVERAEITGANNTGILLGTNNGGTVSGCTIIDSTIKGTNVAGLLWQNNSKVENCSFRASTAYGAAQVVSENGQAAGLIGRNGGSVSRCFAAGTVTGNEASGFAIQAGNIKESYSNCIVTGRSGAAGFHYTDSASAMDCYSVSTVRVSDKGDTAGFSLSSGWPVLTRCYFAGTVETKEGKAYGYAPRTTNGQDQYYYTPSIVEQDSNSIAGHMIDYQGLCTHTFQNGGQSWTNGTGETTHPYALAPGESYPFPRLTVLDHWGDWPQEPAGFPVEENILGVFYYTATELGDGRYRVSVYTSALKCSADGKITPEIRHPFAEPMTVELKLDVPPEPFGMGVFWSEGFRFDVTNGKDKGYYYEGKGEKVHLGSEPDLQSSAFYPGYRFVSVSPDVDNDEYEIELKFKHNSSSDTNGQDWECEFQYSEEKGFTIDLD